MNYGDLETEIVSVLNAYLSANTITGVSARQMPENQNELLQDYSKALVNVSYTDSTYADPASTSEISQEETIKVACYLQCNSMKDAITGGFKAIEAIKAALIGYRPKCGRTRMWVSDYGTWMIEGGQLQPMIEFAFRTVIVQVVAEDEPSSGLLKTIGGEIYEPGQYFDENFDENFKH